MILLADTKIAFGNEMLDKESADGHDSGQ